MADRPWLLDLFCGAGGAGMGYYRAGFEVVGVDLALQRMQGQRTAGDYTGSGLPMGTRPRSRTRLAWTVPSMRRGR